MSQGYVGEIRMFGGTFAPEGWMFCAGQDLPISEYETLFQLIGTTYGGDGESTFSLPDLRGRVPVHMGTGSSGTTYQLGEKAGVEQVLLNSNQAPIHNHAFIASTDAASATSPSNTLLGSSASVQMFHGSAPASPMSGQSVSGVGGGQPHENMQLYLVTNFIISLFGVFPSQ